MGSLRSESEGLHNAKFFLPAGKEGAAFSPQLC